MSPPAESPAPLRDPVTLELMQPILDAAYALGLDVDLDAAIARAAVWGQIGASQVAMGIRFVDGRAVGFAHFAKAPDPVLGEITVEPWTGQARGRQPCGDPAVDDALAVHGDPRQVRAWLDHEVRGRLVELFAPLPRPESLVIKGRRITLRGPRTLSIEAARVEAEVRALVALVEGARLSTRTPLDRVVHNALEDPEAEVRERNASELGELLSAAGPDARYGAALRLLRSDDVAIDRRLDVLRIVRSLPPARVRPIMEEQLESGPIELARRAVGWAKETRSEASVRHLVRAMHRFEDATLQRTIIDALGEIGDPRAQPILLKLLDHDDEALRRAAVAALGAVGNDEAVAALSPMTKGLFTDREMKRLAREAIDEIRGRQSGEA